MNFKKVLIIGAGRSGIAIANSLSSAEKVILYDKALVDVFDKVYDFVEVFTGESVDINELVCECDTLILSPGIPTDLDYIKKARELGKKVIGEVEAAYLLSQEKTNIIGITGTNGKTTTTSLVYEIIKNYQENTYALGNIGTAFAVKANEIKKGDNIVLELSSFQLESIEEFKPKVSAVLNITPDHLDRHKTMSEYIRCKENVFKNQTSDDFVVLNYDDEVTRKMNEHTSAKSLYFTLTNERVNGTYFENNKIYLNVNLSNGNNDSNDINNLDNENQVAICDVDDLHIIGMHNVANAMAAVLLTYAYGVPVDVIKKTLLEFNPVEHRIEYVRTLDGVKYYNDSKGTNPDSSIKAIDAMKGQTVIIIGGYDKHISFDDFVAKFNGKIKFAVIIGQVAMQLKETCDRFEFKDYEIVDTFEEAISLAHDKASDGDNVLLSPACASWGMFKNYEERGKIFKDIVNKL